jgi:hypothetical protein
LLQDTSSYALFAVFATSSLDHHGMNTVQMQQLRQDEARRPRPHDSNLGA